MNILLLGGGGREHAFAWKLAQSPKLSKLYIAPGNAGTQQHGENVDLNPMDFPALKEFCVSKKIEMVIVGAEAPLVAGVVDYFSEINELKKIKIIGPAKEGAALEGSKKLAKAFMLRHGIPTATAEAFNRSILSRALEYLDTHPAPYVLKADGLAAGKGVVILNDLNEAKDHMEEMLEGKFGLASSNVLVEQHLEGVELSVFVLTDGESYVMLPEAKDYKRVGEGDTGLNTGGMGAVSPVSFADAAFMEKVEEKIVKPTIAGLQEENIPFVGFLFIGLMKVGDEPFVIEYNVRMGDPESEVVLPRIQSDFLELLEMTVNGTLKEATLQINSQVAATVMMVSGGYPEEYEKEKKIEGVSKVKTALAFHAGTTHNEEGEMVTNGGRVIALTGQGDTLKAALDNSYKAVQKVTFENAYFRKDIGFDLK